MQWHCLRQAGESPSVVGIEPVQDLFESGDILMPAYFLVQRWINEKLDGNASPQLRYDVERAKRVIQIVPKNLLTAMWLQLARTIEGNRDHRTCKECGRWFEVSTDDGKVRATREFCSDPCKSRNYRGRKAEVAPAQGAGNEYRSDREETRNRRQHYQDLDIQEKGLSIMARSRRGRSEGSIYQRESDGQWVGCVSLGYGGDGKRKRRVVYGATKREVQDKIQALHGKALSGANLDVTRLTVGAYLERWLETTAKSEVRPTTLERYNVLVHRHLVPVIGSTQLAKLHPIHIEGMYAEMERNGASAWTRRMAGTLLGNALRRAVRLHLISSNPVSEVAKARPEDREMLYLNESQTRAFLAASEGRRLHALFALALGSGMRQGELLGLQWSDIDFQSQKVAVARTLGTVKNKFILKEPKSKRSRRTITLPAFTISALQSHRAAMLSEGNIAAAVFCTRTGQHITKSNLTRQVFRPILKAANDAAMKLASKTGTHPALLPEIRFHDLRHTHATTLLARGNSVKAVSHRLGHASIEITLKHYAARPARRR